MGILDTILNYLADSGFGQFHWTNAVMIGIGLLFIALAIKKGFEPLLLVPIGFGILIGNIPYDASKLPLGVHDGPVAEHDLVVYALDEATLATGYGPAWHDLPDSAVSLNELYEQGLIDAEADLLRYLRGSGYVSVSAFRELPYHEGLQAVRSGRALVVNRHSELSVSELFRQGDDDGSRNIVTTNGGRLIWVTRGQTRAPEVWSLAKQDIHNASIFWWLFAGVGLAGFYPPLIFLGIGALTDFGPMLANPKTLLLGAAAQFGIFGSLLGAIALGFSMPEAASIGIIGGADGPTAIFTCSRLAPDLLGAVALAAYSYMAMVPIIQPPIIKLLTSKAERSIRMAHTKEVSQRVKIIFPVAAFLLTAFIAPGGLPLLGMLFFGNLLRESLVTTRLMQTVQGPFIDIVTILLGITVGAKTAASTFLTVQTIYIFLLGITAFAIATATGVLFGKLLNAVTKEPINPMIGAAGVSAVPMAARVVHRLGLEEDKQNFLLMHAMGPNVAGVIGSAVAAGVLLSALSGGQ
ncbi:MAG: sodium ion-translocating decarboxylase subunit beta [Planctomycetota bacterium]